MAKGGGGGGGVGGRKSGGGGGSEYLKPPTGLSKSANAVFKAMGTTGAGDQVSLADVKAKTKLSQDKLESAVNELRRRWVVTASPDEGLHRQPSERILAAAIKQEAPGGRTHYLTYIAKRDVDSWN